jgi:hypothetical protein
MADEIAIPESIARRLAQTAAQSVPEELEKDRTFNAETLSEASSKLTQACRKGDEGDFVSVEAKAVADAAAFSEHDVEAGQKARAFLENNNVW